MNIFTKDKVQAAMNRLRQNKGVQKLLTPLGKIPIPRKWIFVVGCYNSGTTLLTRILASHSDIGGLPAEGAFLTDALTRPEDFGWTRMWCRCLDKIRIGGDPGLEKKAARIKRQWSLWYPAGAPNLLEKSVANTTRMLFFQKYFQPAYFIYIIRNGYAVAEGIRRRSDPEHWKNPVYRESYPISLCAEQWLASEELVKADSPHIEHLIQVYYEALTADAERTMRRITDFLEIEPLPARYLKQEWPFRGEKSIIRNMNKDSFDRLSVQDIAVIEHTAGTRLTAHGYDLSLKA